MPGAQLEQIRTEAEDRGRADRCCGTARGPARPAVGARRGPRTRRPSICATPTCSSSRVIRTSRRPRSRNLASSAQAGNGHDEVSRRMTTSNTCAADFPSTPAGRGVGTTMASQHVFVSRSGRDHSRTTDQPLLAATERELEGLERTAAQAVAVANHAQEWERAETNEGSSSTWALVRLHRAQCDEAGATRRSWSTSPRGTCST